MNPVRIRLFNFRSYAEADLDLRGVTLAVVAGPNGAGKSTLFGDALLYCLFGVSPTGALDDLIQTGKEEMAVEVQFLLDGVEYRVYRSRSSRGQGKSVLEFYRKEGGVWVPISGSSIAETEARIEELLRVDAKTFTAASLVLQNRSDEFTRRRPAERKQILRQILGLEVYERLQGLAKGRLNALEAELRELTARQAALNEEIGREPVLLARKKQLEEAVAARNSEIAALRTALEATLEAAGAAESEAAAVDLLRKDLAKLQGEISSLEEEQRKLEERVSRARDLLAQEDTIVAKAEEFALGKERAAALKMVAGRLGQVVSEVRRLLKNQTGIEASLRELDRQIREGSALLEEREALEVDAKNYEALLSELSRQEALQEAWVRLNEEAASAKGRWEREKALFEMRRREVELRIAELERKAGMLDNSGCIDPSLARCIFLTDAIEARASLDAVRMGLESLDTTSIQSAEAQYLALVEKRDALGYDEAVHKAIRAEASFLRPRAEMAQQIEAKAVMLKTLEEQRHSLEVQLTETKQTLERLRQEEMICREAEEELGLINSSLPGLEVWAKAKEELLWARDLANEAESLRARYASQLQERREALSRLKADMARAAEVAQRAVMLKRKGEAIKKDLETALEAVWGLGQLLGRVEQELQMVAEARARETMVRRALEEKAPLRGDYQQLVKAFGNEGIPALIIENAVPELEEIANDILTRLTKGRMRARFETQRVVVEKGKKEETLEILVSDGLAERPYETFSGGEKYRIDFAIRIGLAKLLARRAGASVRLLVLDEGFGSQDVEGRRLLLEAIASIESDFDKVLVMTHIQEIKDAFPARIEVQLGPEGSIARVA